MTAAAADMVPATAPLHRFDPSLVAWYGNTIQSMGETAWTIEALHLNDGRRLYVSDLIGDAQSEWIRLHQNRAGGNRAGAGLRAAAVAAASDGDSYSDGSISNNNNGNRRQRHYGEWRGLHMQRTCQILEQKGLVEWPDGRDGGVDGGGEAATGAAAERTIEAVLPGGRVVRTVRTADARRVNPAAPGRSGRPPTVTVPRLTPAGRIVWLQLRLGLAPRDTIVLALIWSRFKSVGYFIKSDALVRENVWMTDQDIRHAFGSIGRAGYIKRNQRTGRFLTVRRADEIEPYGPMLGVIEDMVYGARAGEYVYGDAYDDEINRAYAKTVEALGGNAWPDGGEGGGGDEAGQ